jgi:hypothetical protein
MVAGTVRALRRRILTPSMSQTQFATRGFTEKSPAARERFETVGRIFLTGFGIAVEAANPAEAELELERIEPLYRGFAYEGASMGFAVLDGLPGGGRGRVERSRRGRAAAHVYMVNVGVGWALARLPRFRWSAVKGTDGLLRWLVLDGYGFHQAYFKTQKYVHECYRDEAFPWPVDGPRWHAAKVIDQGVGRAMWFVGGGDPELVARMIDRFDASRRADLYAGAGLAATYAGAADKKELMDFWELAGPYRAHLAQGSAFAATARLEAGLANEHTELATSVFCGMAVEEAAALCARVRPQPPYDRGEVPDYELWRRAIAAALNTDGRCDP